MIEIQISFKQCGTRSASPRPPCRTNKKGVINMKYTSSIKRVLMAVLLAAACIILPVQTAHAATPTIQAKLGAKVVKKNLYVKKKLQIVTKNGSSTVSKSKPKYKTSNKTIATVNKKGLITAKKPGTAVITVTYKKKVAKIKIMVYRPVTKIVLNKTSWRAEVTKICTQLKATCTPKNASSVKNITWSSSNTNVARVDKDGLVTAVGKGTCTITAKPAWPATSKVKATCKVTVVNDYSTYDLDNQDGGSYDEWEEQTRVPVSSITLSKTIVSIQEGASLTLTATVKPDNATDKTVTWSSDNTAIAKVSNGKVTGVKPGTTFIRAKSGNVSAVCGVTVTAKPDAAPVTPTTIVGGVTWDLSHAKSTTTAGKESFYVVPNTTVNDADVTYVINGGNMLLNGKNATTGKWQACVPNSQNLIGEANYGKVNKTYQITVAPGCVTGAFNASILYKGQTVASTKFVVSEASDGQIHYRVRANAINNYIITKGLTHASIKEKMQAAIEWILINCTYEEVDCQAGAELLAIIARDNGYKTSYEDTTNNSPIKRALHIYEVFDNVNFAYHTYVHIYDANDNHLFGFQAQGHM